MPANRYHILLLFLLSGTCMFSQSDSLKTAQLLDSALMYADKSSYYLDKVEQIEQKNKQKLPTLSAIWVLRAKYELRRGNPDEASKWVAAGKIKFKEHPQLQSYFYSLEGSIYAVRKEFDQAINSYRTALRKYDAYGMKRDAAYVKNNIANIFFNLNDFESAYGYAKASFEEVYRLNDTVYYPQIAAVLAISEAKTNQLDSAEKHAELAISDGTKYRVPLAVIIGKYALGDIHSQKKEWEKARNYYAEVVTRSEQLRLVQYEVYGRIGLLSCNVALQLFDSAIEEGEQVIELNDRLNMHFADYTVYQQLSEAYNAVGKNEKAFLYLRKANVMYREYSSVENKKVIQELLARYEAEKREKDLSQKELELSRAIIWILVLAFILALLIVGILWLRKRTSNRLKTMQLESERNQLRAFVEGEERERERLAADIHDGIAGTLTGLSLQMQQLKSLEELETVIQNLQAARNEVRLISKNILPFNLKEEGWKTSFQRFIETVQSPVFSVFFIADFNESQLNNQRGIVVYRILQELIQNTLKHANASECELMMTEEDNRIYIQYSDNGKGTTQAELEKGNGWQSICTRLAAIEGTIAFPENPLGGFKIDLSLPKFKIVL